MAHQRSRAHGLPQQVLAHLADAGARQRGGDFDALRELLPRKANLVEKLDDLDQAGWFGLVVNQKERADRFPKSQVRHRYNSCLLDGRMLGKRFLDFHRGEVLAPSYDEVLSPPGDDDQQFYQRQYVSGKCNIKLDHEAYIFTCLAGTSHYTSIKENGQLLNSETHCCPSILHGNGGSSDKALFNGFAKQLGYVSSVMDFIETSYYGIVDQDMITVSFLTPEYCNKLIELAEQKGTWTAMPGDKFPAQEIRLWDIDPKLFEDFEIHWQKHIKPIIEEYWSPMMHYNIRDAFVMKYTLDTQKSLALHTDASLVTGSVKLNDDYEGGELYFPRQDISNIDIPAGEMLLFPGQVTHGHRCDDLISGTKYSLTIWTSRHRGDINK